MKRVRTWHQVNFIASHIWALFLFRIPSIFPIAFPHSYLSDAYLFHVYQDAGGDEDDLQMDGQRGLQKEV